jgi:CCR4-NOT transcription complex subunit 1
MLGKKPGAGTPPTLQQNMNQMN